METEENNKETEHIYKYEIPNDNLEPTARLPPPSPRKLPCSATAALSRTISELDSALKEFKLSTEASRESLKTCPHEHCQMETVRIMIRNRPSTPVLKR